MPPIPRDKALDSTWALLRHPYDFIRTRCQEFDTTIFEARIMLQRTIFMMGKDSAECFYDTERFQRQGAAPRNIQVTLFGREGIQNLDDAAHRHRKAMFMSLMSSESIANLAEITKAAWTEAARVWIGAKKVVLYKEVQKIHTRAVCEWAGVPLTGAEVAQRTRQLTALFDKAGSVGPRNLVARYARFCANRWAAGIIRDVRSGRSRASESSPVYIIAFHKEADGRLLKAKTAGVELLNVLRPTVAISVFITFAALALHDYPECRQRLQQDDAEYAEWFVQEVRRFFPFFPSAAAVVRRDFTWKGYPFPKGTRVLLDLYGTDHDARIWDSPEEFRPERFARWDRNPFTFVSHGGGTYYEGHRCPGEWITIELMKVALQFLARDLTYEVPEQDLQVDRSRMPALPRSRFVISRVNFANKGIPEPSTVETKKESVAS